MESWDVILLMKLMQAMTMKDRVESWEFMKLLQAVIMKGVVESWDVILLMKLLQALTMKDIAMES